MKTESTSANENTLSEFQWNHSDIRALSGKELRDLGNRIEEIALRLKDNGQIEAGDRLHRLGDEVEHFFDSYQTEAVDSHDMLDREESDSSMKQ